jgi:hypothetical protein
MATDGASSHWMSSIAISVAWPADTTSVRTAEATAR